MGGKGTYVINKQTPTRQIWLSSPIRHAFASLTRVYFDGPLNYRSGPKRYNYATDKRQWRNNRDGHALTDILSDELSKLSGVKLRLKDPEV